MEGLGNNTNQSENTESDFSLEQIEIAEKAAREKLELLLGKSPTRKFAIRFMNLQEYKKMIAGEKVGSGEANVFGAPVIYRPDLMISKHKLEEIQKKKSQGHSVELGLNNIREASVKTQQRLKGVEKRVKSPDYPLDISSEDPVDYTPSIHLSRREQEEYFAPTFEGFLKGGVEDGWHRTIKGMTDWEMSANAVGRYSGFYGRRSIFDKILSDTSQEAKRVDFGGKIGEEKKKYFLYLLRNKIIGDRVFDKFDSVEHLIEVAREQVVKLKEDLEKLKVTGQADEMKKLDTEIQELENKLDNPDIGYLDTVREFVSNEDYLDTPGNLQKLFYALANIDDIEEHFRDDSWDLKKLQYQVAVAFKAVEIPQDAHWGREQWGYADRSRDSVLATIALMPDPELEKILEESSKENEENAFPVFSSYGSLKFPKLNK